MLFLLCETHLGASVHHQKELLQHKVRVLVGIHVLRGWGGGVHDRVCWFCIP